MLTNENKLERLLRLAATEPASRPEFYKTLLDSKVFILGHSESEGKRNNVIEAGSHISIQNWQKPDGTPIIPFFPSVEVLQKSIEGEEQYLNIPARDFFEITKGSTLILNPKSDYGKEFFSNEIESLLMSGINQMAQGKRGRP